MKSWWVTLRVGDWGIQLFLLWLGALVYFLVSVEDPARYLAHLAFVSVWSSLFLIAGYLINNYCDRVQDRGKESSDPRVQSDPGIVLAVGVVCLVCAAVLLVIKAPNRSIVMVGAVQIIGGLAYSVPGPRLKEKGVWGLLTAAAMQRVPAFLMIVLVFPGRPAAAVAITTWFLVMGLVFILEHQLADLANDKRVGVRTWATSRGRLRTQRVRHRLYRIHWMVGLGAAVAILVETPTLAGTHSGGSWRRSVIGGIFRSASPSGVGPLRRQQKPARENGSAVGGREEKNPYPGGRFERSDGRDQAGRLGV